MSEEHPYRPAPVTPDLPTESWIRRYTLWVNLILFLCSLTLAGLAHTFRPVRYITRTVPGPVRYVPQACPPPPVCPDLTCHARILSQDLDYATDRRAELPCPNGRVASHQNGSYVVLRCECPE